MKLASVCASATLAIAACSGTTEFGAHTPGAPGGSPGSAPSLGDPFAGAVSACAAGTVAPAPVLIRRLTRDEYLRSVTALLGPWTEGPPQLPPDNYLGLYDTNSQANGLTSVHAELYFAAAKRIAEDVMTQPTRRSSALGCDPVGTARATCLGQIITRVGRRAYRRPLTSTEVEELRALADLAIADADAYQSAKLVLRALLNSPHFLFRPEIGVVDGTLPGARRLDGYEVATRLAYALTASPPSDALLDAAGRGELAGVDGIVQHARALLSGAGASAGVLRSFAGQWLELQSLAQVSRDAARYPEWNEALRAAMAEETLRLVEDLAWRDGANLLDIYSAQHTFVNPALASLYGLSAAPAGGTSAGGAFAAQADAYVSSDAPDTSFPGANLLVDGAPAVRHAYLRFAVTGVSGQVTRARLRLRLVPTDQSTDGPAVYATSNDWSETTLTWNNKPATGPTPLADAGAVPLGALLELDVTSLVKGNGTYSFALVPTSSDGVDLLSREDTEGPELVVEVADQTFERVELGPDVPRQGILTHASLLTITERDGVGPILRGKYVRENVLCQVLSAPPADIPPLAPEEAGETERERLAQHRTDPTCAACHAYMDPVGFGLENFDAIGRFRTADAYGNPLTGAGELTGFTPAAFVGGRELATRLRAAPQISACLSLQHLRYTLGRSDVPSDACTVERINDRFAQEGHSYRGLMLGLVTSDAFRFIADPTP